MWLTLEIVLIVLESSVILVSFAFLRRNRISKPYYHCLLCALCASVLLNVVQYHNLHTITSRIPKITTTNDKKITAIAEFQAFLIISNHNGSSQICGASLIKPRFLLTAAHCIAEAKYIQILLGVYNLTKPEVIIAEDSIKRLIIHPKYHKGTYRNDLGLIEIIYSAPLGKTINIVSLPSERNKKGYAGKLAKVFGFTIQNRNSNSTILKKRAMIISNALCAFYYGNNTEYNAPYVVDSNICAYGNKGSFPGDSGSALVLNGVQIGVVSIGTKNKSNYSPTVYTRLDYFLDFINDYIT